MAPLARGRIVGVEVITMNTAITADSVSLDASQLENAIECERMAMIHADGDEARRYHFQRMRELIAKRTPETIERMERIQGLRA